MKDKFIEDGYVTCVFCGNKLLVELAQELNIGGYSCQGCYKDHVKEDE